MDLHPRKRKTSEKACFLCQKDMVECDERTPCSRCIIKGVPHMCFSSTRASPNYPFNNNIRPNISPTTSSPPKTSPTQKNTNNTTTTNNQQSKPTSTSSNTSNTNNNNSNNNNNNNNNSSNNNNNSINNNQQPTDIVKSDYNGIANLLISELRELKDGQKKIYDEIIYLRGKNEKLELLNEALVAKLSLLTTDDSSTQSSHHLLHSNIHTDSALSYPMHEVGHYNDQIHFQNIFIVIDLLKNPPMVLNCSKSFSQLIGYSQDEIIGLPWTEITHPNLMEKTMSFFQQQHRNLTDKRTMEIAQVYKCRDGSIFSTIDTHSLVYDSENTKPICDIVNIRLLEGNEPIPTDIINSTSVPTSNRLRLKNTSTISSVDESPPSTPVNYQTNTTTTTATNTANTNTNNISTTNTPTKNYNNSPFNSSNNSNPISMNTTSRIYEQPSTPSTPITPNQLNSTSGMVHTPVTTTSNDFNNKMNINDIPIGLYNTIGNEMELNHNHNIDNNQFLIPNAFTFDPSLYTTNIPTLTTPTFDNTNNNNNNNNNGIIQPSIITEGIATVPTSTTNTNPNPNPNLLDSNGGLLTDFLDPMIGDSVNQSNNSQTNLWSFDSSDWNNSK
ncbi:hypothetical protein DICPUDRAFT_147090 [Dictyostelium purpureum]|uniref:PAS domain-containing protein n=1 Tax=Dictyostelium purpureum TaxID=5786 RepID=F0Z7M7_DICPU|nr:uncharacterized protein DICPUDRAFT_147090 [Dictyostelium purpureum]EGC40042.1 hypothetical protein DICPUDRAFT_147090 [Dictyostelium purpureum]|eukprot:XP_003283391.1 hypothetical protein DICPUDRAFT_147090 [Dictyostelium purpureum]